MRVITIGECESAGEEQLVAELETWNGDYHVNGVAIIAPLDPKHVDALIITPTGCTVIEVKSVRTSASGRIEVPLQQAWSCGEADLDLHLQPGARNPLSQAAGYAKRVGGRIRTEFPGAFVEALVVLVQHHELLRGTAAPQPITVEGGIHRYGATHPGIAVTTLTRFQKGAPLRRYFHEQAAGRGRQWDVETVSQLFELFGWPDAPDPSELISREGFLPRAATTASVSLPALHPKAEPTAPPMGSAGPPPQPHPPTGRHETTPHNPPTPSTTPQAADPSWGGASNGSSAYSPRARSYMDFPPAYTPTLRPRRHGCLSFVLIALIAIALGGGALVTWLIGLARNGTSAARSAGVTQSYELVTTQTRNIACRREGTGARCDIAVTTYPVPKAPARCVKKRGWGHSFVLSPGGAVRMDCPGTLLKGSDAARELPFEASAALGSTVCTSHRDRLECVNGAHGFRLARAKYTTW